MDEIERLVLGTIRDSQHLVTPREVREHLQDTKGIEGSQVRSAIARLADRGSIRIDTDMHITVV